MKQRILVVVDMQKDFITGALGNSECAKTVEKVADLIEKGNYEKIILTYDTHNENYLNTIEGKNLLVIHCIKGTEGYELNDKIKQAIDTISERKVPIIVFEKPTFGSMELANYLIKNVENKSDTQIDFCGVCTGICIISNVLLAKAAVPEANIRVIANACACVTPETHQRALEAMKLCHIEIVK